MDGLENGANELDWKEIEELLSDETQPTTPAAEEEVPRTDTKPEEDVSKTQAFAHRLKESTEKARKEEREAIAKSFGYESYEAMTKQRESNLMKDKGLDPDQVAPVVEELVQKRLNNDPRMKELEELRKRQIADFAKKEIAEITELTDGEITSINQLSPEVIDVWKKSGSLKKAYMEVEGINLVNKIKAGKSKGTTDHLANPSGISGQTKAQRPLTQQEKNIWKIFNPSMTDDELNKKKVDIT